MAAETAINVTDFNSFVAGYPDAKQIEWVMKVIYRMRGRSNPFHGLIAGINGRKPIKEVANFKACQGTDIVLTLDRPLGGPGVQGAASQNRLVGHEETPRPWSYRCKVGLLAHAISGEQVMETQTVFGSDYDVRKREQLTEWFKWRMATDIEMEMKVKSHARNTLYPNNKSSVDQLGTGDYLNLGTITQGKELLNANQAQPFDISRSNSGAEILSYLFMGSSKSFAGMTGSSTYQQLVANADERGDSNKLFRGGLIKWNGDYLYDWRVEDGTQIGPLAAPCAPIAYLAVALPATTTTAAQDILGGGSQNSAGTDTTNLFFQYFENSQYIGHEGEKRAADTTTVRYLAIKVITGADAGKIALFSYKVNNGNKIVMFERLGDGASGSIVTTLTGSSITWDSGAWTVAAGTNGFAGVTKGIIPAGSIIYQVNAKGTPYLEMYGLGQDALLAGYGNIAPNKAYGSGGGAPGQRLLKTDDYGRIYGLGYQQVWGVTCTRDANDMVNGYIKIVSAWQPSGFPDIT